jgi:hypothetical protein
MIFTPEQIAEYVTMRKGLSDLTAYWSSPSFLADVSDAHDWIKSFSPPGTDYEGDIPWPYMVGRSGLFTCNLWSPSYKRPYTELLSRPDVSVDDRNLSVYLMKTFGFVNASVTLYAPLPEEEKEILRAIGKLQTETSTTEYLSC